MRKTILVLGGALCALSLSGLVGCSSKPSCKLLYKRYKKCDKMPLTEEAFLKICDKYKDKAGTAEEIKCSKESDCDKFKSCLKSARKKARMSRMKKRWKEAMEKSKKGDYSSAMTFCEIWKEDLEGDLKKECESLPAKAVDGLMKEIAEKRDKGQVSYKEVKCWDLKRYAKKAGEAKAKAADLLCKEIEAARDIKRAKEAVAKQLKKDRPYLPYYCSAKKIEDVGKLGSPWSKKAKAELVDLCFKKLGKTILEKQVPKQKYFCLVKDVYEGIQKFQVKDPDIDKLMEQAKDKCEKK